MNLFLPILIFGVAGWWVSQFLTRQAISIAHDKGILAQPNARSSHAEPTPRIGGIGPIGALLILIPFAMTVYPQIQDWQGFLDIDQVKLRHTLGLVLTIAAAAILGFVDDLGKLSARSKFFFQWSVAALPLLFGLRIDQFSLPYVGILTLHPILSLVVSWVWVLLMMNVVNFMDGINGLAARFLECFGFFLILSSLNLAFRGEIPIIGAIAIGAGIGFLHFNLGDAKTFLGDTGSQAIGAFVAVMAMFVHKQSIPNTPADSVIPFMIFAFPLIFDVVMTLIRRTFQGSNLFEAHREHLYQRHLVCMNENHERTLHFVSNQMYVAVVAAAVAFRLTKGPHGSTVFLVTSLAVVAVSIFCWYRVLRLEDHRTLKNHL